MIEVKGFIIDKRVDRKCAEFKLKSDSGKIYVITNCHLLFPPKFVYNRMDKEIYMGTYEFLDETNMFHYPVVFLEICKTKKFLDNIRSRMEQKAILKIYYQDNWRHFYQSIF